MDITQIIAFTEETLQFVKQAEILITQLKDDYASSKNIENIRRIERAHDTLKHLNDYLIDG
jgi:hypothetical protein